MDQDSVATARTPAQDGAAAPDEVDDGLVRLRRQSDWSGRPRGDDSAAASAYWAALDMATATLAAYDGGTASHSDDVVTLCLALSEQLGVRDRDRAYLLAAAELHDIGKVGVPPQILSKPAALDPGEWKIVREHPNTGERILAAVPELAEVARIVRHCHERWDGDGYPDGLAGEAIPLASRIVFCADAFHAIRGDRPYRRGRSARAALAEVQKHSGTQFDPAVVCGLTAVAARLGERRRRRGLTVVMGGRRSQRLAALLLTMAVGGAAMATTGVLDPSKNRAGIKAPGQSAKPALPLVPGVAADARDAARTAAAGPLRKKAGSHAKKARGAQGPGVGDSRGKLGAATAPGSGIRPGRSSPEGGETGGAPPAPPSRGAPEPRAPATSGAPDSESKPAPAPAPLPPVGDGRAGAGDPDGGGVDGGDGGAGGDGGDGIDPGDGSAEGGHTSPGNGQGHGYGHENSQGGHRGHDDD